MSNLSHPTREKATRRVSPFLAWGDFHARSRFARSTIPEEKWGTTRSLLPGCLFSENMPTEAEKGQSINILQIPKNISNQEPIKFDALLFKSKYFFQITVEKFDKSKKLLQILRKLVDPEITF